MIYISLGHLKEAILIMLNYYIECNSVIDYGGV